ncbi:MAG: BamA/TamA family outer membrane protein [Rikenellaceae bacterium]
MNRRIALYIVATLTICTLCLSCSITRHIPEDKLLLSSVVIEQNKNVPKDELIASSTLERYIRQSPNRRLLGFNFYIWAYSLANPDKSNWWNDFKRKVGEEPTYIDIASTIKSQENLNIYMDSQGFYSSEANYQIDTLSRRRGRVQYTTHQGKPYIINGLKYEFRDSLLREFILTDTINSLIQRGDIFSVALLDQERERISSRLRNEGYYDFSVRNIEYRADTLAGNYTVDLEMIINQSIEGYDGRGKVIYRDNRKYRISEINIYPDFNQAMFLSDSMKMGDVDTLSYRGLNIIYHQGDHPNVREKVLRQMVPLTTGSLFSAKDVEQTYQNLMSLGYFKSARINFKTEDSDQIKADSTIMSEVVEKWREEEGNPRDRDREMEITDSFLSSEIMCTPALRQSYDIELEGSTTSSFYGLYATMGYQNRNIFRGAEVWNVDFTVGYEHMKAPDAIKTRATEFGISTGLSFPRFILPFNDKIYNVTQPKTTVEISANIQDRPYYNRTLSSASINYEWRNRGYSTFSFSPIDINLIDMNYIDEDFYEDLASDYLKNSYETQFVAGFNVGYMFNNQRKSRNGNYTILRVNAETAGNFINGIEKLFNLPTNSDGFYEIFNIRYAQYVRTDINASRRIAVGSKTAIAGRIYAGAGWAYGNSTAIPFDRLFYSGGSNSMRGWTPRTLGPGESQAEIDTDYPSQLGDMKLEANLEFRFPVWNKLYGATFLDVGNIWYLNDSDEVYDPDTIFALKSFYKQLGFNTGLGLRLDIQFAILRLDWGIQLHNPNKSAGERWVIKDFSLSNSALNFGVGYPF